MSTDQGYRVPVRAELVVLKALLPTFKAEPRGRLIGVECEARQEGTKRCERPLITVNIDGMDRPLILHAESARKLAELLSDAAHHAEAAAKVLNKDDAR